MLSFVGLCVGRPASLQYATAKAGVNHFSKALGQQLREYLFHHTLTHSHSHSHSHSTQDSMSVFRISNCMQQCV